VVLGSGWVVQGHWSTRVVVHKRPFGSLKVPKVEGSVTVGLLIAVHVALVSSHSVDAAAAAADADADVDVDAVKEGELELTLGSFFQHPQLSQILARDARRKS